VKVSRAAVNILVITLLLTGGTLLVFWVKMLMFVLTGEHEHAVFWLLMMFFLGPIGAILCWLIRVPQWRREQRWEDQLALEELRGELERLPPPPAKH